MINFIDDLFYNKKNEFNTKCVDLYYYFDKKYCHSLCLELGTLNNAKYINFTPSGYKPGLDYQSSENDTHRIIGQEFDIVIVLINDFFYFDNYHCLKSKEHPNPKYNLIKFLYQAVTRARKKLIIVVDNLNLYRRIQDIINDYGFQG